MHVSETQVGQWVGLNPNKQYQSLTCDEQYPKIGNSKTGNWVFDIFVVTYRVTNFLPKLIYILLFSTGKNWILIFCFSGIAHVMSWSVQYRNLGRNHKLQIHHKKLFCIFGFWKSLSRFPSTTDGLPYLRCEVLFLVNHNCNSFYIVAIALKVTRVITHLSCI